MAATLAVAVGEALGIDASQVEHLDGAGVVRGAEALSALLRERALWLLVQAEPPPPPQRDPPVCPEQLQAAVEEQLAEREAEARARHEAELRRTKSENAALRAQAEAAARECADLQQAAVSARASAEQNDDLHEEVARLRQQRADEDRARTQQALQLATLQAEAGVLKEQLEVKSRELQATVAAGHLAVPIHKGNQFECDFLKFVHEHVFEANPCLADYELERTGGGKQSRCGDLAAFVPCDRARTLTIFENKVNGSRDDPKDVSAEQTGKFYRDMAETKARAGVIVSCYGGISDCSGGKIVREMAVRNNILFVPRFCDQDPRAVAAMITHCVLLHGVQPGDSTRGDVPVRAMQDTVQLFTTIVQENRQTVNHAIQVEQLLHGRLRDNMVKLAAYNRVRIAKTKGVAASVKKRAAPAPLPAELAPYAIAPAAAQPSPKRPREQ